MGGGQRVLYSVNISMRLEAHLACWEIKVITIGVCNLGYPIIKGTLSWPTNLSNIEQPCFADFRDLLDIR